MPPWPGQGGAQKELPPRRALHLPLARPLARHLQHAGNTHPCQGPCPCATLGSPHGCTGPSTSQLSREPSGVTTAWPAKLLPPPTPAAPLPLLPCCSSGTGGRPRKHLPRLLAVACRLLHMSHHTRPPKQQAEPLIPQGPPGLFDWRKGPLSACSWQETRSFWWVGSASTPRGPLLQQPPIMPSFALRARPWPVLLGGGWHPLGPCLRGLGLIAATSLCKGGEPLRVVCHNGAWIPRIPDGTGGVSCPWERSGPGCGRGCSQRPGWFCGLATQWQGSHQEPQQEKAPAESDSPRQEPFSAEGMRCVGA